MQVPEARPLGPDVGGQWVRWWTSAEWTREVDAWVACRLAERGRRIMGAAVTYRARFWSVVRCYPSAEGLVWFKENNPGHRFEAGLVATLARIAPYDVIVPLAVDRSRGWLLTDDHGTTLTHPDVADQRTRCIVVRALARLQCAVLGRVKEAGMLVLTPTAAGDRMRGIAREWAGLRPGHPLRLKVGVLDRAERAADVLDRRTAALSDAVPLDLELNDVYAANIFADRSSGELRPRFFDFGNAIWGHPFVSLHGFLESVVEWTGAPLAPEDREALYGVYLEVWRDHLGVDPHVLQADLAVTEALVNVHRLVAWACLIPHADAVELSTRAEIPLKFLTRASR